ncbi:hypothetical protein FC700_28100 [Bacillus mycoides]|nr:hypothetical protein FC700_28100 [Bacillus mycoides]
MHPLHTKISSTKYSLNTHVIRSKNVKFSYNLIHNFFNLFSPSCKNTSKIDRLPYIATLCMQNYIPFSIENHSRCNYNGFRRFYFHFLFNSHNILKEELAL